MVLATRMELQHGQTGLRKQVTNQHLSSFDVQVGEADGADCVPLHGGELLPAVDASPLAVLRALS